MALFFSSLFWRVFLAKMVVRFLVVVWLCTALPSIAFTLHKPMPSRFHSRSPLRMAIFEGNPIGKWIWDSVWKLGFMQPGKPGTSPTTFGDGAQQIKGNILQMYGGEPSVDGAPVAEGEVEGLLEGSLFLGLRSYYEKVTS